MSFTLAGCTSIASGLSTVATDLSTSSPSQVSTYYDATTAANLAFQTIGVAATLPGVSHAQLIELQSLNEAVHSAWLVLKAANDAGQSIDYAAFNAAFAAYQSYCVSQGIPEAKPAS